jgi:sulfoxide reductase catalytic subunit YedY
MLIKKSADIPSSEITPKSVYMNRRKFLIGGAIAAGAAAVACRSPLATGPAAESEPESASASTLAANPGAGGPAAAASEPGAAVAASKFGNLVKSPYSTTEKLTPGKLVENYNNYYEFSTSKYDPARLARNFKTSPWSVAVEGEVMKPATFDLDEVMKMAPLEERVYRHRCVEAWSIIVPWIGFPLSALINKVQPTSKAKYVEFVTALDPKQMPGLSTGGLDWPYTEGLRMDEAMNPLAILCFGMYGDALPNQDGAPIRMVIPWKYGFKSAKAIVKIRFVEEQPKTAWNKADAHEYGFYSNVNPAVDHPRWSQASEKRLDGSFAGKRIKTLMFNGYSDQVASLYSGMDLRKNY